MRRREFIALVGGAALAGPLAARAQQPDRVRRIGVLLAYAESDPEAQAQIAAFREGLQKLGWTEGRNVRIDYRWAGADPELMQQFAKDLVALQHDLILSHTTPTTAALLQQTRTIPNELPVQMPVKYLMIVNLRTAKMLGLTVPPAILLSADEVIE